MVFNIPPPPPQELIETNRIPSTHRDSCKGNVKNKVF